MPEVAGRAVAGRPVAGRVIGGKAIACPEEICGGRKSSSAQLKYRDFVKAHKALLKPSPKEGMKEIGKLWRQRK